VPSEQPDGADVDSDRPIAPETNDSAIDEPQDAPESAGTEQSGTSFRRRGQTFVAAMLGIGVLGDLWAAINYRAEISFRLTHLATARANGNSATVSAYGDELPIVWVLAASTVALAVVLGGIAFAVHRDRRGAIAALWAGGLGLLLLRLLLLAIAQARYQGYRDPGFGLDVSPASTQGQYGGAALSAGALVTALLVAAGMNSWSRFRGNGRPNRPAETPSNMALRTARWAAIAAVLFALIAPVAWVGPLGGAASTPDGWDLVALADAPLALGALFVAVLVQVIRPGRRIVAWTARVIAVATAMLGWVVAFIAGLYAEVAIGTAAVDGYAAGWWPGVLAGALAAAAITLAATVLLLPAPYLPAPCLPASNLSSPDHS
jgi:hypothetical protein